jgi:hypothetical protein
MPGVLTAVAVRTRATPTSLADTSPNGEVNRPAGPLRSLPGPSDPGPGFSLPFSERRLTSKKLHSPGPLGYTRIMKRRRIAPSCVARRTRIMEFRWIAVVSLWTFLIGPVFDASGARGPATSHRSILRKSAISPKPEALRSAGKPTSATGGGTSFSKSAL